MNLVSGMIPADPFEDAVEPSREVGAYEHLWREKGASFKRLADRFRADPGALASHFVSRENAKKAFEDVLNIFDEKGLKHFGIRLHHTFDYPARLRQAKHPLELLYFLGDWSLTETPSIAVVGSRKPSEDGLRRAARLARELVKRDITLVSGLAAGIDTAALNGAIQAGGRVIGVIGTPICEYYPKENKKLQDLIAEKHLLVSQVPVLRYYAAKDYRENRSFFPERNATMSALTKATVIVEAAETSGTLTQARAALFQRRKLFILNSCFERKDIDWPARFEKRGAIRVREPKDIWDNL